MHPPTPSHTEACEAYVHPSGQSPSRCGSSVPAVQSQPSPLHVAAALPQFSWLPVQVPLMHAVGDSAHPRGCSRHNVHVSDTPRTVLSVWWYASDLQTALLLSASTHVTPFDAAPSTSAQGCTRSLRNTKYPSAATVHARAGLANCEHLVAWVAHPSCDWVHACADPRVASAAISTKRPKHPMQCIARAQRTGGSEAPSSAAGASRVRSLLRLFRD